MKSFASNPLPALPLGTRTRYCGQVVFLNVYSTGAVLGIEIAQSVQFAADALTSPLLQSAFLGIHDFEGGLCMDEHVGALLLTQWIPGAQSWADVSESLDKLFLQAHVWQGTCDVSPDSESHRHQLNFDEVQMRDKLMSIRFNKSMNKS